MPVRNEIELDVCAHVRTKPQVRAIVPSVWKNAQTTERGSDTEDGDLLIEGKVRAERWGEVGHLHVDQACGQVVMREENGSGGQVTYDAQLYFCDFSRFRKKRVGVLVPRAIRRFRGLVPRLAGVVGRHLLAIVT